MTTKELREKYLNFFAANGHAVVPGGPLLPENDPTVLFTTAGMHPLVPYLLGEKHPQGSRLTNVQRCIRTQDIDEVGDPWHLTFFEMLGNWSLGDYFKEEAIKMSFEFLTQVLNIPVEKLAVTCFVGDADNNISADNEASDIWLSLGVPQSRIKFLSYEDNWWGPAGQTGPCGPDTEMFYWTGADEAPKEFNTSDKNWVEIWNDVFMQYNKNAQGNFEELKQKNVDTGMGTERTVAILNHRNSVYEVEPLSTIVSQITALIDLSFDDLDPSQLRAVRIIADHLRAATFILAEDIPPANVEQGYILRRLIRRAIRLGKQIGINDAFTHKVAEIVIDQMGGFYGELRLKRDFITDELIKEEEKFTKTLAKGLKEFDKLNADKKISGPEAFKLFATYGFPIEMTKELGQERGAVVDEAGFNQEMAKHQDLSRQGAEKKFKGGLADHSEATTRLHTAAHLMLASLRQVLGDHVYQKGSNITSERLRFDFSHPAKLTEEQKAEVERLVNEQIQKSLSVEVNEVSLEEAKNQGAMGVFEHKYGDKVKVYSIGDFSKEICGGPHVKNISELGCFKIKKEESSSTGVRRIKAILE